MNRQVPKAIKTTLILLLCLVSFLTVFPHFAKFAYTIVQKHNNSEFKDVPPIGYAPYITNDIVYSDDYTVADIGQKMDIFYDRLIEISEDGYEIDGFYVGYVDSSLIYLDRDNKTISFYEKCDEKPGYKYGEWYKYDFDRKILMKCDVNEEIYFWILDNTEFSESDIYTQMDMFYDKLKTMEDGVAQRINNPILSDSIDIDRDNFTITYRLHGRDQVYTYSFSDGRMIPDFYLRWNHNIG